MFRRGCGKTRCSNGSRLLLLTGSRGCFRAHEGLCFLILLIGRKCAICLAGRCVCVCFLCSHLRQVSDTGGVGLNRGRMLWAYALRLVPLVKHLRKCKRRQRGSFIRASSVKSQSVRAHSFGHVAPLDLMPVTQAVQHPPQVLLDLPGLDPHAAQCMYAPSTFRSPCRKALYGVRL